MLARRQGASITKVGGSWHVANLFIKVLIPIAHKLLYFGFIMPYSICKTLVARNQLSIAMYVATEIDYHG